MFGLVSYALFGVVTSYHIGNSLMNDGLGNNTGTVQNGTYGIQAMASSYGHSLTLGLHLDSSQSMPIIWENPDGELTGGVDVTRSPYGHYDNALANYHWDHVLVEPYLGVWYDDDNDKIELADDKAALANFINFTRQNPENADTIFYVYEVWPRLSWDYEPYWDTAVPNDDATPSRPRREYFDHLMSWANQTFNPQGILVRSIPVGEVWYRISKAIGAGEITEMTFNNMYRDDLHASGPLGRYVAAATIFATMFQTDVADLIPSTAHFGTTYPLSLYQEFNKIIWDVVSSDPNSGVADLNDDGQIDGADLMLWRGAYSLTEAGDTDGDGDTDGKDFLTWQRSYVGALSVLTATAVVVPEPHSLALILLGLLSFRHRVR